MGKHKAVREETMGKHKAGPAAAFDLNDARARLFRMEGWDAAPAFRAAADWLESLGKRGIVTVIGASPDYGEYGTNGSLIVTVETDAR